MAEEQQQQQQQQHSDGDYRARINALLTRSGAVWLPSSARIDALLRRYAGNEETLLAVLAAQLPSRGNEDGAQTTTATTATAAATAQDDVTDARTRAATAAHAATATLPDATTTNVVSCVTCPVRPSSPRAESDAEASVVAGPHDAAVAACRARLMALYTQYAPAQAHKVDAYLQRYRGREAALLAAVQRQFGQPPHAAQEDAATVAAEAAAAAATAAAASLLCTSTHNKHDTSSGDGGNDVDNAIDAAAAAAHKTTPTPLPLAAPASATALAAAAAALASSPLSPQPATVSVQTSLPHTRELLCSEGFWCLLPSVACTWRRCRVVVRAGNARATRGTAAVTTSRSDERGEVAALATTTTAVAAAAATAATLYVYRPHTDKLDCAVRFTDVEDCYVDTYTSHIASTAQTRATPTVKATRTTTTTTNSSNSSSTSAVPTRTQPIVVLQLAQPSSSSSSSLSLLLATHTVRLLLCLDERDVVWRLTQLHRDMTRQRDGH